jgi:two-component system response regulator
VTVILVEDKPADAELIGRALRSIASAPQVRIAQDGTEALDLLFSRGADTSWTVEARPRLVLLDIKLPKVDGFDVLKAMKGDARTRAIPVVMFTSSIVERDVARCYLLGANGYVQKPMHFDQLREVVAQVGAFWLQANVAPPPSAFVPVSP